MTSTMITAQKLRAGNPNLDITKVGIFLNSKDDMEWIGPWLNSIKLQEIIFYVGFNAPEDCLNELLSQVDLQGVQKFAIVGACTIMDIIGKTFPDDEWWASSVERLQEPWPSMPTLGQAVDRFRQLESFKIIRCLVHPSIELPQEIHHPHNSEVHKRIAGK
jgi:hypothetical protein